MEKPLYYAYILTNFTNTVLYIGVSHNLEGRTIVHTKRLIDGFTKKYRVTKLVYFEEFNYILEAIAREKQLKNWHREWKYNLIKSINPEFKDLMKGKDSETSSE